MFVVVEWCYCVEIVGVYLYECVEDDLNDIFGEEVRGEVFVELDIGWYL